MRWNRRFSLASLSLSGWFTTATGARNICRFATASGWVRPVSSRRWYTDYTYDNALAETINRLYKSELIHKRGPWKSIESRPPAEFEALYEQSQAAIPVAA